MSETGGGADASILEQLFEDSPVPLAILDPSGDPRRVNDAHAAFLEAFGDETGMRQGAGDAPLPIHIDALTRARRGEVVEYLMSAPRDEPSMFFTRLLVPVRDGNGEIAAVVSVLLDVTEEHRAASERERMQERMLQAQKLESLGLLAGGVAHDFNNLLVGVLGHASLLLGKLDAGSPLRRHVEAIEKAATRASEVARQMLEYAGRGDALRQEVDLSALVAETADLMRVSLPAHATLELAPGAQTLVSADATQLRQVVLNLISNAAEALTGGRGTIAVCCGMVARTAIDLPRCFGSPDPDAFEFAFVEVRDDGAGMDAATLSRVFDPFFSTKRSGRGLGLSTVLGVVRAHDGLLFVDSERGRGTCMRVLLPVRDRVSGLHRVGPELRSPRPSAPLRALIVDDEPQVRDVAASMLELLGYRPEAVGTGEEALVACERESFALVLLDMNMPGLDGGQTLIALRARKPELPVLLMSGFEPPPGHGEAFLRKPFSLKTLEEALGRVVR